MPTQPDPQQSSLFRRLMIGFGAVILLVFLCGFLYVAMEARATQRARTAAENKAHTEELLLHMVELAGQPERIRQAAASLEDVRAAMFRDLDYHSQVRVRIWEHGALLYNSRPELSDKLPLTGEARLGDENTWVQTVVHNDASGLVVERTHEVDDRWMLSYSGVSFLMRSTIFSLPLLLLPAWFIIGIGLRPLNSIARAIESRSALDITPLPESTYRELSPLVSSINQLMARLRQRIENEHEFLTDAAHELKTPLAAIQLNAHLLQSRNAADDPARHAEVSAGLRDSLGRATRVVHQLLALERARSEDGDEELPTRSIEALVRDRLASAVPLALQRGIDLDFQADGPCERALHEESMWALVDNLIGNAIKYSPEGGRISVHLAPLEGGSAAACRLTFVDQGPGIAEELRERVFERFYRVPGQGQSGSGLGLAIAERAAARNGAHIQLQASPEGRGLLVVVDFD